MAECQRCEGRGHAPVALGGTEGRFYNHVHIQLSGECPFCEGSGKLPDHIDQWPERTPPSVSEEKDRG